MGGGQTQLYEMVRHGLSYVADPKQVIFTKDERIVLQALLDGEFEVGFVRTDQIERHTDENGNPIKDGKSNFCLYIFLAMKPMVAQPLFS